MQAKMKDGSFGLPVEYNPEGLQELLKDQSVDHVEVFNATPEELEKRKKKFNHKLSRGFKKAPRVNKDRK